MRAKKKFVVVGSFYSVNHFVECYSLSYDVHHYQWLNPIALEPSRDFLYLKGLAVAVTIVTDFHLFISEFLATTREKKILLSYFKEFHFGYYP